MSRTACPIVLTPDERAQLDRIVRARTSSQQQARRAQIVLRAANGASNTAIAAALGVARHTVHHWRQRFATARLAGLRSEPRLHLRGRTPCAWTVFDSWMEERDPAFVPKAVEVMEVELHPPTDGPPFCVDEKTGIGVRTPCAPSQPLAPGQPARREFAYVRHGTADLLAAFEVQTGTVRGIVRRQHRSAEFIALLRLLDAAVPRQEVIHLILDPVRLHCSAEVAAYIAVRPWRFRFHWLPGCRCMPPGSPSLKRGSPS
jgi:DNA-binding CsgD family transcriptional regulator/transposase